MRLNDIQTMVQFELQNKPNTRNSDRQLIKHLYHDFFNIGSALFDEVIDNTELPSFETIRRTRQKIQQNNIELRAIADVEAERIAKQVEYLEYARG